MRNHQDSRMAHSLLNFGEIIVLMKTDVANFCQHLNFGQDFSKTLPLSLTTTARESQNVTKARRKSFERYN